MSKENAASHTFTIGELFTDDEIRRAKALYDSLDEHLHRELFARRCAVVIIAPVLDRINQTTGQENDARYLAYVLEHVFNQD